jgi:hypothetical protein
MVWSGKNGRAIDGVSTRVDTLQKDVNDQKTAVEKSAKEANDSATAASGSADKANGSVIAADDAAKAASASAGAAKSAADAADESATGASTSADEASRWTETAVTSADEASESAATAQTAATRAEAAAAALGDAQGQIAALKRQIATLAKEKATARALEDLDKTVKNVDQRIDVEAERGQKMRESIKLVAYAPSGPLRSGVPKKTKEKIKQILNEISVTEPTAKVEATNLPAPKAATELEAVDAKATATANANWALSQDPTKCNSKRVKEEARGYLSPHRK